jgi:hypothetical protein
MWQTHVRSREERGIGALNPQAQIDVGDILDQGRGADGVVKHVILLTEK